MKVYRVHEFAELASVTVRALHHYDRLGLLKPARTEAGYRAYVERDLERLEQIVALRFVGVPLKQIRALLDGKSVPLVDALRGQRAVLLEKRRQLDRAISAIRDVELAIEGGKAAEAAIPGKIVEAIRMQDNAEFRKKYFSEEAWASLAQLRETRSEAAALRRWQRWKALYRDIEARIDADPAGAEAEALVERWMELMHEGTGGDAEIQAGYRTAWAHREEWPGEERETTDRYNLEKISAFIGRAMEAAWKKYYSDDAWVALKKRQEELTPEEKEQEAARWRDLYRDIANAVRAGTAAERDREFVRRWRELMEPLAAGDPEIFARARRMRLDYGNWPAWLKRQLAALRGVTVEDLDGINAFMEQALDQG